jgi:hypothetical protein
VKSSSRHDACFALGKITGALEIFTRMGGELRYFDVSYIFIAYPRLRYADLT